MQQQEKKYGIKEVYIYTHHLFDECIKKGRSP